LSSTEKNVELLYNYYGNATTCIIHKRIFDDVGLFNEEYRNGEDYDFWLRACLLYGYELHRIPMKLASYRIHSNQLTVRRGSKLFKTIDMIKENIYKKMGDSMATSYKKAIKAKYEFPLQKKIRRMGRTVMFKTLPNSVSDKILKKYMERKK